MHYAQVNEIVLLQKRTGIEKGVVMKQEIELMQKVLMSRTTEAKK